MFRDDFLNNNSILLEYLAEVKQEESALATDGAILEVRERFKDKDDEYSSDEDHEGEKQRPPNANGVEARGFVDRMRTANPLGTGEGPRIEEDPNDRVTSETTARPSTANSRNGTLSSSLGVDPSDPKTTVRKLLKHIEVLTVRH